MPISVGELVAPGIAAIRPYEPGKPIEEVERELGATLPPGGVIKLASNENPLGPSPRALEAARSALTRAQLYPDGGCFYLRRKLAARLGVGEDEVAIGNGSNEILDLIVRTFCAPGDEVLAHAHTFLCYGISAHARGADYREVERGAGYRYQLDALADAATGRTRVVFVANPDNPTGVHAGAGELVRLARRLPERAILVIDEAYHEYADAPDYPDALRLRGERQLLVTLRTFSKIYGLAGLRCGYGVGPRELVGYLDRVRNPFNVSALAQAAAEAALDDVEHVERSRRINRAGMAQLADGLARLGAPALPSQANFVLFDVGPREGREVYAALLRRGVIVRPMGAYGLPHHLRVTVGSGEENARFLEALAGALAS
jgi:histidinol-phosphate aminotransferase